jgi:hypothetical protein
MTATLGRSCVPREEQIMYLSELNDQLSVLQLLARAKSLGLGSGTGSTGDSTGPNLTNILGTLGSTALGVYGAGQASNQLHSVYDQITNARAPSLSAFNNAVTNPNSWYTSAPAMGAADAASRALSTQGNSADNPSLISQLSANQLGGYNKYLTTMAGPAFGAQPLQAQLGQNLATAAQGIPANLASGLGSLTGTDPTSRLLDGLKKLLKPNSTSGSPDFTNSLNNSDPFAFPAGTDPTTQFTDTSNLTPDLYGQLNNQPSWFGQSNLGGANNGFDLNSLGSF